MFSPYLREKAGEMLSIVLGRTTPVYAPGELFMGDVVINTTGQCKILNLSVNFCGVSLVSFIISEGEGKSQTRKNVEQEDTHLDVLHPLVRSYRGVVVEPGVHTYPFSLRLPRLLPTSYKSTYGQVSYYVHVHLQTSANTLDVRKPFIVLAPVNINLFPASLKPKCAEVMKKVGLIGNRTMHLKAAISKTSFVPGDLISVFVEVSNDTSRPLQYLFCSLKQTTTVLVHLQDKTVNRVTKQCVTTLAHKIIDGHGHYSWLCELTSPSLLPPTIGASTIVFVTYSILVSAKLKHVSIPPDVEIPVIFGTRTLPILRSSVFLQPIDTKLAKDDGQNNQPTAINPRRRITITSQPPIITIDRPRRATLTDETQVSFADSTRRLSTQLQSIATDLTRRLSTQLQSRRVSPVRRFSCRPQTSSKA